MKSLLALLAVLLSMTLPAVGATQTAPTGRTGDVPVGSDVRIHYVEQGDPNAKLSLLFVPGWATSTAVWRDQMARFSSSARVIAIDPRSQGESTVTVQSNTPEQRAQDMQAVAKALDLRNVVLVGWSQGVQDVAAYAAAFGGNGVLGYVLVDAPVGAGAAASVSRPDELKQLLERLAIYQRHPKEYLRGMMNAIIRSPQARERIDEYVAIGLRTPPDLGVSMLMMDFVAVDRRPALAKFNRPTLVIAAAESGEIDAQRDMAAQIKGARFETIKDAGHAVFLDQPERFHQLLADFLQQAQQAPLVN